MNLVRAIWGTKRLSEDVLEGSRPKKIREKTGIFTFVPQHAEGEGLVELGFHFRCCKSQLLTVGVLLPSMALGEMQNILGNMGQSCGSATSYHLRCQLLASCHTDMILLSLLVPQLAELTTLP